MQIYTVGAELFHVEGKTDGRTDRHGESNVLLICIIVYQ
jgi:hypothetical protein